jgi:hypothetical protein
MSPSEEAADLSAAFESVRGRIDRIIELGEVERVPRQSVTNLMSGAVKLYAALAEDAESESESIPIIDGTVSTTEAMVVACALLRAHHLNPFDLALWFSRTGARRGDETSSD